MSVLTGLAGLAAESGWQAISSDSFGRSTFYGDNSQPVECFFEGAKTHGMIEVKSTTPQF